MSPDNATVNKTTTEASSNPAAETQTAVKSPINLADLAADYKVRHPRFSAPATADDAEPDLSTEDILEPVVPKEEQKLYLTETGSADSTKKTWRDSSYSRLYIMGGVFGVGAVVLGLMFNMKLPNMKTASVSMAQKDKKEEVKEPEFAGDGEYAAQAALSGQDGSYGTAKSAAGHGFGPSGKVMAKPNGKMTPTSNSTGAKQTAAHTVTMPPPRRATLPSTMAYNPTPARRAYIPAPDYDTSASTMRRSYSPPVSAPAVRTPAPVARPSKSIQPSVAEQPGRSAEERRLAAIAATSTTGGTSDKETVAPGATLAAAQTPQGNDNGYQEAAYLASEAAVLEGIPQQLINRSQKAEGRLLMGVAFTPGDVDALNGQPVEVAIENPLQSGLPAGARILATVDFPKAQGQLKSALIRLTPTAIAIGDAEYPLPKGVVILTGENGKPLIAKRQGSEFLRSVGSTFKTVLGGAVGGLTTLVTGNGTGILSGLGGLNGLGGLANAGQGASAQQATEILALRENTAIQINIVKPLSLPAVQADSDAVPEAVDMAALQQPSPVSDQQLMMFTKDITDAELMAIASDQLTQLQPEQPQSGQSEQPQNEAVQEVQDAQ